LTKAEKVARHLRGSSYFLTQTVLNPRTDKPSSVRVPVLSKTKVLIRPATLILKGEMQKMLQFLSLPIANSVPHVIAAGRAGGIVMVMRFKDLSMI
jgi:hypothetical protein